jgi:hypothetical protein
MCLGTRYLGRVSEVVCLGRHLSGNQLPLPLYTNPGCIHQSYVALIRSGRGTGLGGQGWPRMLFPDCVTPLLLRRLPCPSMPYLVLLEWVGGSNSLCLVSSSLGVMLGSHRD